MSDSADPPPTFEEAILAAALGDASGASLASLARRSGAGGEEAIGEAFDVLLGQLRGTSRQQREARHRLANALASVLANVELAQTLLSATPPESEEEQILAEALGHAVDGARRASEVLRLAPAVLGAHRATPSVEPPSPLRGG